jgi:hypothetical protein
MVILETLQVVLILVIGYFIFHFKSYFKKKGDNLADKEDIEELTQIVEEVRLKYSADIEKLRAELSLGTQRRSSVFEEEKEALIVFFSQLNVWIWETLRIEAHEYYHGNYEDLSDKIIKFREAYKKTNVALSKVQLLIKDPILVKAAEEFVSQALLYHSYIDITISGLKRNLTTERINADSILRALKDQKGPISKEDPLNSYLIQTAKEIRLEREELLKDYHKESLAKFTLTMRKRDVFSELTKSYLNKGNEGNH